MVLTMLSLQHNEGSAGEQPHAFSTFALQMRPMGGGHLAATCCGNTVSGRRDSRPLFLIPDAQSGQAPGCGAGPTVLGLGSCI